MSSSVDRAHPAATLRSAGQEHIRHCGDGALTTPCEAATGEEPHGSSDATPTTATGEVPSDLSVWSKTPTPTTKRQKRLRSGTTKTGVRYTACTGEEEADEPCIADPEHGGIESVLSHQAVHALVGRSCAAKFQVDKAAVDVLTNDWVERIGDMIMKVCDEFGLNAAAWWTAARVFYRYLAKRVRDSQWEFADRRAKTLHMEACVLACVLIAAKLEDCKVPCAAELGEATTEKRSRKEIREHEVTVLSTLQWDLQGPTPRQIGEQWLVSRGVGPPVRDKPLTAQTVLWRTFYFYCDIAISVRELVFEPASCTAAAALLACVAEAPDLAREHALQRYTADQYIADVTRDLKVARWTAENYGATLRAVRDELAHSRCERVHHA